MSTSSVTKAIGAAAMVALGAIAQAGPSLAEAEFRRGKDLVEHNASDAMDGTRAALEDGVQSLEEALKLGCADKRSALKLLAMAYNTLAFRYSAEGSAERKRFMDKEQDAYLRLGPVAGDDVESQRLYAFALSDPKKKIEALEKLASRTPSDIDVQQELGTTKLQLGDAAGALKHFRIAVAHAPDDYLRTSPLEDELRERGLDKDADEIHDLIAKRRAELKQAGGN